jgi:hypothetical protein
VVGDVCGGGRMRLSTNIWLRTDGDASLSLCGGVVSYIMGRAFLISRRTRH